MSESAEEWTHPLQIKLHIPRSGFGAVARPRLVARLNEALANGGRLTVIVAPAGYGKSTLLADWVNCCGRPAAWLSLDRRDDHLPSFLRYFVAAVRTQFPEACPVTLRALQAPRPPAPEDLAELLANDLALLSQVLILVLDDYHLIRDPAVQTCMGRLLEVLPENLHLALAGRLDSSLPLSRFAARGQLCELRGDALQFTLAEVTDFLRQNLGSRMASEVVSALHARTEGWIAALRLAVQSLSGQADLTGPVARLVARADRQVASYLLQEVVAQQPEPTQDFLLRTAILDRLCAPLCAAVTGDGDTRAAHATLAGLSQSNPLLQSLDEQETWYRYHQMLQDSLRATAARRLQPEQIAELHRRAGAWYAASGFTEEAIEHSLAAGDLQAAIRLTERFVQPAVERVQAVDLERRLRLLPIEVQETNPALLMGQAFIAQVRDELRRMPALMEAAEAGLQRPDWQADDDVRSFVRRLIHVGWSLFYYYMGQIPVCLQHAESALEPTPRTDQWIHAAALHHWARAYQAMGRYSEAVTRLREALAASAPGNLVYNQQILLGLAQVYRASGEMHRLEEAGRQMVAVTLEAGMVIRSTWARMLQGVACYQMNDLEGAIRLFAAVVAEPTVAHHLALRDCVAGLALAYQAQGLVEQANEVVTEHIEFLQRTQRFGELPHARALAAVLALRQGNLHAAQQAAEVAAMGPDPAVIEWLIAPQLVRARVLVAQGEKEALRQAVVICDDVARRAAEIHNISKLIETHALRALAYEAQGHTPEALGALGKALKLAVPRGYIRGILDLDVPMRHGVSIERLLLKLIDQPIPDRSRTEPLVDYARRLLSIIQDMRRSSVGVAAAAEAAADVPPLPRAVGASAHAYVEALTEREIEVLGLLAQHYSNKEIGAQLVITLATVKRHTTNIFGKLEARNRRDAVARARQLGILPDR
jgi:LuxR family maltose regulon positive regulatory protein